MDSNNTAPKMSSVTCVLLGVAEVKLPLRRLPANMRVRVANVAHRAVLGPEPAPGEVSEELEEQRQSIGVIDAYYALDEVVVQITDDQCEVKRGQDVVVMHKVRDVIIITPMKETPTRVVYISRNDSFGRAAVVLQMKSAVDVEKLLGFFPDAVPPTVGPTIPCNELTVTTQREPKSSWSKGMGRRFTSMVASLTTSSRSRKSSPKSPGKMTPSPETPEPPTPEAVSSSDSEDELESIPDDTDCQSEGKYYENLGLDANVQERLYDGSIETSSKNAFSSGGEANSKAIDHELRFFLESDVEFVKTIQSLEEDREKLAGPDTPQFIRENLTLLFMQVKSLIRLHSELLSKFKNSGYSITKVCEAIMGHQADYESYVYFMENIPIVDKIIQNHMDYFKVHMPDLPEKLRKPRMRLHYYVLTLETLHNKCSLSQEKKILQEAMEVLKVPLKKADSKLFLGAVTGSPFDISDLGNLIRHSDLQLRKGGDLPRRTYHVLALETLLILTVSKGKNYQYATSFRMDQVGLGKQERGVMFTLQVRNGPRGSSVRHVFKAKNINVQQQWINVLREILSEKEQPVDRNSIIEGEIDPTQSVRRSKVRRGQSFEKASMRLIYPTTASDSEELDDDRPTLGRSVSDGSHFGGKRGMIKKSNSSILSRNKTLIRQQSASFPSPNQNSINWKNSERLPPLTIQAVFPTLEKIILYDKESVEINENHCSQISTMIDHEKSYLDGVSEQLGTFLNDEFAKPPQCIINHMRALYAFHYHHFTSLLLAACATGDPEEIARCFTDNSEEFLELYTVFLADRARYDEQMKEMDLRHMYLYPILHFELYFKSLTKFLKRGEGQEKSAVKDAIGVLHRCALEANRIILTEAIDGAPFDLDECGPILHEGKMKVRQAGMILKQEMYVVLLNSLILLLEPRIPCYKYIDSIRMDTVGMGPSPDGLTFQLEVRTEATKTLTYSFRAPNKAAKSEWELAITKLLSKQVELLKERLKKRLGDDEGNMKYIEMKGDTDLHRIHPRRIPLETSL